MKRSILLLFFLTACARNTELPVMNTVPEFSLIERNSRAVKSQELARKVWVADFVFTSCGGFCPLMTEKMKRLQDVLPSQIQLVSFSVDPERDTLKYSPHMQKSTVPIPIAGGFATGNKDALYKLSKDGFKLAIDDTGGTEVEPITHSVRFALVDQQGRIRGYYSMDEETELARLVSDAKSLL